jgi:hypothetical protein
MCITYILTPLNIYMFLYQYRTREGKEGERETGGGSERDRGGGRERKGESECEKRERERRARGREGKRERGGEREEMERERERERESARRAKERRHVLICALEGKRKKMNLVTTYWVISLSASLSFAMRAWEKKEGQQKETGTKSQHISLSVSLFFFFSLRPRLDERKKRGQKALYITRSQSGQKKCLKVPKKQQKLWAKVTYPVD